MTQDPYDRTAERLSARLHDLAGTSSPAYRDEILQRVDRTRQRPAWTFPERWIPMTVIAFPGTRQRGVPRTWKLLVVTGLLLTLAAGLVAGAMRLLPTNLLQATMLVPVVDGHQPWGSDDPAWPTMVGGMDLAPDGRLAVPDTATDRIVIIGPDGSVERAFGETGDRPGSLEFQRNPADDASGVGGVAWLPDGSIAVADAGNQRIQVFADSGAWVTAWGGYGIDDGSFLDPYDLARAPGGTLWVLDDQRDDLSLFSREGNFQRTVGAPGSGPGQLRYAGGIAFDDDGNLWIADFGNRRVQSWDPTGRFRWSTSIPTAPDAPDRGLPLDVDVDDDGFGFVTTDDGRLFILTPDGVIVQEWDRLAGLDRPLSVAVGDEGTLYLAEQLTGVIHRLALGTMERTVEPAPAASFPTPSAAPERPLADLGPTGAFGVPFQVTAPAGWVHRSEDAGEVQLWLDNGDEMAPWFIASIPYEVYADPCDPSAGTVEMGATPRDLAQAIAAGRGIIVGDHGVQDATIDGRPAVIVDLTNRIDMRQCDDKQRLHQWRNVSGTGGPGFAQGTVSGARQRLAVVDVDGTRVVFWLWFFDNPASLIREAYAVFDSLRIP